MGGEDIRDCLVGVDSRVPGVWRFVLEVYGREGQDQEEESGYVEGLAAGGDGAEEVGEGFSHLSCYRRRFYFLRGIISFSG